jgi:type II secretory pathway component GspD/PulD (secretin)
MKRRLLAAVAYLCCVASITISAQSQGAQPLARGQALVLEISLVEMVGAQPDAIERIGSSRDVLNRLMNEGKAKLTATLHVRTRTGENFKTRVGQRNPIQTASVPVFRPSDGARPGTRQLDSAFPQIEYENTGLSVEGSSNPAGDGALDVRLNIEMSGLDTSTGTLTPTFVTRSLTNSVRMRMGETTVAVGLIQQEPQPRPGPDRAAGPDLYHGSFIVLLTVKPVQ